jgi:hypothetical protein
LTRINASRRGSAYWGELVEGQAWRPATERPGRSSHAAPVRVAVQPRRNCDASRHDACQCGRLNRPHFTYSWSDYLCRRVFALCCAPSFFKPSRRGSKRRRAAASPSFLRCSRERSAAFRPPERLELHREGGAMLWPVPDPMESGARKVRAPNHHGSALRLRTLVAEIASVASSRMIRSTVYPTSRP